MPSSKTQRKIGVFSHGGLKNLGDEALFAAVIQNIQLRVPDAQIVGFTANPEDTELRHGIPTFPIARLDQQKKSNPPAAQALAKPASGTTQTAPRSSWKQTIKAVPGVTVIAQGIRTTLRVTREILLEPKFLWQSYQRLRGVELLLVAGSQQLNDIYGAWAFPISLYKWSVLSRLAGTKVALLSVGAGPISSSFSQFLIRRVLRMCSYRSYRDTISSELVTRIGSKGLHPVFPDLAYSMRLPEPRPVPTDKKAVVVGINPVPFYDGRYWATPNPARYQDYVDKFARFGQWLDQNGYSTLFFPTQARADVLTIQDIRAAMNRGGNSTRMLEGLPIQSIGDLVTEIARADLVIANRYHGILLSLALNKPVLGVAYHEKSRALLEQVGQGDYVLNIGDFSFEELVEKFKALHAHAAQSKEEIAARIVPLREALDRQYDSVLQLIGIEQLPSFVEQVYTANRES
jgi:polysaccharide pyruvyl transferase WcaK-like protein